MVWLGCLYYMQHNVVVVEEAIEAVTTARTLTWQEAATTARERIFAVRSAEGGFAL